MPFSSNLQPFSTGSHFMRLNSKALEGLEIFRNLVTTFFYRTCTESGTNNSAVHSNCFTRTAYPI